MVNWTRPSADVQITNEGDEVAHDPCLVGLSGNLTRHVRRPTLDLAGLADSMAAGGAGSGRHWDPDTQSARARARGYIA